MKQKRKVKSLLPQRKDRKTSFLTTLLLVLSTILCIGSATLLTSTVSAANVTEVTFTGLNDNMEAVYNLKFVDPENLSGDGVADVYVHNDSLYISPSPVIVSGSSRVNEVESGVYSHILGGENNTIYSDNVTIIAGYNNTVSGGANSTILGGMNNDLGTGAVLIGGRDNEIENTPYNRGIYLIGGKKVKVINSVAEQGPKQNIFVLGGDNSSVTLGSNIIIGGSGLKINTGKNIFAFSSPKPFTPMSSKTFYLNMENGVGIGTSGVPGGLAVNGAFMLLNEQSKILQCTGDNIGQIYLQDGCLIGCTKISSEIGAGIWEILNRSEHCKTIINPSAVTPGDDDYFYPEEEIPETPSYTGYCIPVDFTGHTRACSTPEVYQNVFFETSIVDQGGCNAINLKSGENKCVFECLDGYHLGYESVTGTGCYADCKLDGKTIKHNQTGTRYSKTVVRCSDGEDARGCEAKTLICKNGTLYYYSGGRMGGEANVEPLYKECTLYGGYDCQGKGYTIRPTNLLIGGVQFSYWRAGEPVKDLKNNANFITPLQTKLTFKNRDVITVNAGTSRLARGYYQLCKDYNEGVTPITGDGIIKNPNTSCGTPNDYYKLIKCKPGYYLDGDDGMCHPKCSVYIVGEGNKEYMPGTIFTGYINSGASCPNDCEYAVFECKDNGGSTGVWEPLPGYAGKNIKNYKYRTCNVKSKICEGYYITSGEYSNLKNSDARGFRNSIYGECTNIEKKADGNCGTGDTQYKLTGCKEGYHTENRRICTGDIRIFSCGLTLPEHAKRDRPSEDYKGVYLASGHYIEEWIGGWSGGYWGEPQPLSGCDWSCVTGYTWDGKECVKNQCINFSKNRILITGSDENLPENNMESYVYPSIEAASGHKCAFLCDEGINQYYKDNKNCVTQSSICMPTHYGCSELFTTMNTGSYANEYKWECGIAGDSKKSCIECKFPGYSIENGKCVGKCEGTFPVDLYDNTKYIYNSDAIQGKTKWGYEEKTEPIGQIGCSWTCKDGYNYNQDENNPRCVASNPCNGLSGATLYLNGSYTGCGIGWQLRYSAPVLNMEGSGSKCQPQYMRTCRDRESSTINCTANIAKTYVTPKLSGLSLSIDGYYVESGMTYDKLGSVSGLKVGVTYFTGDYFGSVKKLYFTGGTSSEPLPSNAHIEYFDFTPNSYSGMVIIPGPGLENSTLFDRLQCPTNVLVNQNLIK